MTDRQLPAAAQQFINATNAEDRDALIGAFTASGAIDDFGRVFTGPGGIGGWSDAENIGTHNRIKVHSVTTTADGVLAEISVTGGGYNGPGTFEFRMEGDLIRSLIIRG